MNFIHFSPYFPPNYIRFSTALKEAGANVLGLGDSPFDQLKPELKSALTEYYKVDDLHHYDQLVRALGYFTHKYGKIDGIDAHNEYWLETEARLRSDFNIPGLKSQNLSAIKKKSEMKQVFIKAGLPVARGKVLHQLSDAKKFVAETGYPLVAKPDSGVGAVNTYKIENENDLKHFFEHQPDSDYIFEEFIEGVIYSFDGLVNQNGNLLYCNAMRNEKGVMETVNDDTHIYIITLKTIPSDLEEAGKVVIKAFDLKARFFHFEFFRKSDGSLVALEVNMRPPGGFTTDMWNFASNIDIYKIWAEMIVNNRSDLHYLHQYQVCFVSRKFKFPYKHSLDEIIEKYGEYIVFHDYLDKALSRAMGDYCFLVRAEREEKVLEVQHFIHQIN